METLDIKHVLEKEEITTLYQPIIYLHNGEILGFEALSRGPKHTGLHSPVDLIKAAEEAGCIWELEMLFRKKAIEKAILLTRNQLLFLNVDPNIIKDAKYRSGFTKTYLKKYNVDPKNIVFEITERTAIDDYATFAEITGHYRTQNYQLAIDDVGSGYSGLKSISELRPDYVKIDMDLIRDIHLDPFKQSMIKALVTMANDTGFNLIAEGVETHGELRELIRLGVHAAQGYLLHRPSEHVHTIIEDIRDLILQYNHEMADHFGMDATHYVVGKIHTPAKTFSKNISCQDVQQYFDISQQEGVCLISEDAYPEGLIMKHELNRKLADRYGYNLYANRPMSLIMNIRPLIVDYYTPVTKVIELAMKRHKDHLYDDLIVTKNSRYIGLCSMFDLIRFTTDYEKLYAKQLNPLTGLPGNIVIRQVLEKHLLNGDVVSLLYIDINNFKAYNDTFGFEKGDLIIKNTASLLEKSLQTSPGDCFLGHIGGDDFLILYRGNYPEAEDLCQKIIHAFSTMILPFFPDLNQELGFYDAKDRQQVPCRFPLTGLSIAAYYGGLTTFKSSEIVGQFMTGLKRRIKQENLTYKIVTEYDHHKYVS